MKADEHEQGEPTKIDLFRALQDAVRAHGELLDHPEPGLFNWHMLCGRTALEVEEAYQAWRKTWGQEGEG